MADQSPAPPPKSVLGDTLRQAIKLHEEGKVTDAIPLYRSVLEANPDTAQLWCLLGVALKQSGDLSSAISHLEKAVALDPTRPDLAAEFGITYSHAGLAEQAILTLGGALPKLAALGQDDPLIYVAYGDSCLALSHLKEAVSHYQAALAGKHDTVHVQLNLGVALHQMDRRAEAIEAYETVLKADPGHAAALTNIGVAYQEEKKFAASLNILERAAKLSPGDPLTLTDLGVTLQRLGRTEDAIARFNQALSEHPTYAKGWSNLGNAFQDQLNLPEAWEAHRHAVKLEPENPELHWNLAMTLLLAGEFEQGWREYEWRRRLPGAKSIFQGMQWQGTEWQGEPLNGKTLLLTVEQGAGDAIQFARYVPLLAKQGARIVLTSHTSLQLLFTTLEGVSEIITPNDPLPAFDVHAPLMSVPLIRKETMESIPAPVPYLSVPAGREFAFVEPSAKRRVGLIWAGNPEHPNDHNRSCAFDKFAPILDIRSIQWISLQKEAQPPAHSPQSALTFDIADRLENFADTAAAMAELDLVISVDTAAAHLAGALGCPLWLMLPFAPDWRWLTEKTNSPWYPTARLYRQPAPGDWESVIAAIAKDLQ